MRIIAGSAKGLIIDTLDSRSVRPLTDHARGALFNILMKRIEDSVFLDLFAGSGAVGIEALSRGAKTAYLVEMNPKCVEIIRKNLKKCGFADEAKVISAAVSRALNIFQTQGQKFDIIFIGAPYGSPDFLDAINSISKAGTLAPGGILIAEHHFKFDMAEAIGGLSLVRQERYGDTKFSFYEVKSA